MQLSLTVIDAADGHPHDVVLTARPGSKVGDAGAAILRVLRSDPQSMAGLARVVPLTRERPPREPVVAQTGADELWLGSLRLDPDGTLRGSTIRDGSVLTLGGSGRVADGEPGGVAEIRVAGGPAAGGVHRLGLGERTVGLAPLGGIAVADPALADEHLRIVVGPASVSVAAMPGRLVLREGQPVSEHETPWQPGELIEVGNTLLALAVPAPGDLAVRMGQGCALEVDRPPRRQPDAFLARLELPMARSTGRRDKRAESEHAAALARFEADVWLAAHRDAVARRGADPDPAEMLLTAIGPRRRLWERRRSDPDALRFRLGSRSEPARIEIAGPGAGQVQIPPAWAVPITLSLRELGVIGLAGPVGARQALARWLLVQAAVLHSPGDLSIVVIGGSEGPAWDWVRWLPHLRPQHGEDAARLVGNDRESAAERIAELTSLIAERTAVPHVGPAPCPVLLLIDDPLLLQPSGGLSSVLSRGPAAGVYAICLDDEQQILPEECRAIIGFDEHDRARLQVASTGSEARRAVLADQVSPAYARQVARALAPLREDSGEDGQATPTESRLLDMLELDPPTAEHILDGWGLLDRSTQATLGVTNDETFAVDLRRHGPHLLVAGSARSGKSELLQSLVASLAVANTPDALSFVLIDADDSDTFADWAELPHTVAVLSGVERHAAGRTAEILSSELRRRERILSEAQAPDIDTFLAGPRADDRHLARLVIVVDEFATIVARLPEFAGRLIEIAQQGQSLGIHLVASTAHPAEVMTQTVRDVMNTRIALRMTSDAHSAAVLGVADAAHIPAGSPGRGYARLGAAAVVPFQLARIAGLAGADESPVTAVQLPWDAVGRPLPASLVAPKADSADQRDSALLISAVRQAGGRLHLAPVGGPWLAALPELIITDELDKAGAAPGPGRVAPIPYALADLPADRQRRTVFLDLESDGNLVVLGDAGSGRSTLLQTIAHGIDTGTSPDDIRVYVIDCGTDALRSLGQLRHCSALLTEEDTEDLATLFGLLGEQVRLRQELLAHDGYADVAAQRVEMPAAERLPYLVVLLDCWEDFQAEYEDADEYGLVAIVRRLLAEGPAVGLIFVLTSGRSGLVGPLSAVDGDRIVLRLDDAADYERAGAQRGHLPAVIPPGRGLHLTLGAELQVAVPGAAPRAPDAEAVPYAEAVPSDGKVRDAAPDPGSALVGVGGDPPQARYLSLRTDGPGLLVAGAAGSGRSTTLATMLRSQLAQGWQAVVVSPRPSPLRDFAGTEGVAVVFDGLAAADDVLAAWETTASPKLLIVDDLELFAPGSQMNQRLAQMLRSAAAAGDGVIAAGNSSDLAALGGGFGVAVRQSRSGVLLGPHCAGDGALLGLTDPDLPGDPGSPGHGLLVRNGRAEAVQITP